MIKQNVEKLLVEVELDSMTWAFAVVADKTMLSNLPYNGCVPTDLSFGGKQLDDFTMDLYNIASDVINTLSDLNISDHDIITKMEDSLMKNINQTVQSQSMSDHQLYNILINVTALELLISDEQLSYLPYSLMVQTAKHTLH